MAALMCIPSSRLVIADHLTKAIKIVAAPEKRFKPSDPFKETLSFPQGWIFSGLTGHKDLSLMIDCTHATWPECTKYKHIEDTTHHLCCQEVNYASKNRAAATAMACVYGILNCNCNQNRPGHYPRPLINISLSGKDPQDDMVAKGLTCA